MLAADRIAATFIEGGNLMQNSLGLAGDLDDVDLVQDVEKAFGVQLPDKELTRCRTVGDLFELVVDNLPAASRDAERCASAMCFYRLRRLVLAKMPNLELRPATPIGALDPMSVRTLYRAIEHGAGLRPPAPYLSAWGGVSLLGAVAAPFALVCVGATWGMVAASFVIALVSYRLSPVRLPRTITTFGDLVELITARNIGALASQGARLRPAEAWKALHTVCQDHAANNDGEIGAGTLILQPRKAAS